MELPMFGSAIKVLPMLAQFCSPSGVVAPPIARIWAVPRVLRPGRVVLLMTEPGTVTLGRLAAGRFSHEL